MFQVTREFHFCYGHRLLNHPGKCKHLHGHNGRAIFTISSTELDSLGMVVDFGEIKEIVGAWIKDHLDHKMILSKDDPLTPLLKDAGEPIFVLDGNPTAENLALMLYRMARERGLPISKVCLWETEDSFAAYEEF